MVKWLRYRAEALLVQFFLYFFSLLSVKNASALGGKIARFIGRYLRVTAVARDNLAHAIPSLSAAAREQVIAAMWENLGRVAAEFAHIHNPDEHFLDKYVTITGLEHLLAVKNYPQGALLFSGHIGNWEILPKVAAVYDVPLSFIYRPANNPIVDKVIYETRKKSSITMLPKGIHGAKAIVAALKKGQAVAMLVDQKMNDGISVPFFGRNAMTAPALAKLALKLGSPVIPARVKRLNGPFFEVQVLPPIMITPTANAAEDVHNYMLKINLLLEEWIRETPEQWFWVHKRWPKKGQ